MTSRLCKKHYLYLLLAPVLLGLSVIITGCGGEEEEAPPVEEPIATPSGESTAEVVPPKPAGPAMAETVPSTLPALAFMPADAQVAVAIPSPAVLIGNALPLAKALAEPERDIDTEVKEAIQDLAGELGVEADSYEALAAVLGVDSAAPIAAFGDFRKTVASAAEAKAAHDASTAAEAPAEAAPETAEADPALEGSEPSLEESFGEPEAAPDYFADADPPAWVAVLGLSDPEKARTELERIVAEDEELSALPSGTEEVEGLTIATRDTYGYFTTDKHLVLGDLALLRGAAKRVKDPATFRYGTVECPPSIADEAVTLFYGGRLLPLLESAIPLLGLESGAEPLLAAQLIKYKSMFTENGDDPMVITASLADGKFEALTRIDSATHEGLMEKTGQPAPLRLARYLPDSTLALVSMRFTDEYKKQLLEEVVPMVGASDDPNAAAGAGMAVQVINQIGDELSIGVTGAEGGLPNINALLGLSQPESTKGLLQMLVPMQGGVDYEGFSIGKIPTPVGLEVNLSFVDNFLLASTSEDGAKAIIDLHKAQKASALFASLEPPLDIEKPVYQTFFFNSAMIEQAMGVAAMLPTAPATMDPGMTRVINAIREFRVVGAMEDSWLTSRTTVYLKDLEAALATSKAAGVAAEAEDVSASEVPAEEGAAPDEGASTEAQ
jgi:hypothetical protein